jgi:hypothetical protein
MGKVGQGAVQQNATQATQERASCAVDAVILEARQMAGYPVLVVDLDGNICGNMCCHHVASLVQQAVANYQ